VPGRRPGTRPGPFADYLAGLAAPRLTQLLRARPEVGLEPVPRGFEQPAQRLGGADSLATARTVARDAITVGQTVAALGSSGDRPGGAPPPW